MPIKQATAVAVSNESYNYQAIQVSKKLASRETGEVKLDRFSGLPLWSIDCLRTDVLNAEISTVTVSVPGATEPGVAGKSVEFPGLVAMKWATETNSGLAFRADSVSIVTSIPTTKPSAAS